MNDSVAPIGLIELDSLSGPLTQLGRTSVTAPAWRDAAKLIRGELTRAPFPVLLFGDNAWPGMRAWTEATGRRTTVVALTADPDFDDLAGAVTVTLPATVGEVLAAAGYSSLPPNPYVDVLIGTDGVADISSAVSAVSAASVGSPGGAVPSPSSSSALDDPWDDEGPQGPTAPAAPVAPVQLAPERAPEPVVPVAVTSPLDDPWEDETHDATPAAPPAAEPAPVPVTPPVSEPERAAEPVAPVVDTTSPLDDPWEEEPAPGSAPAAPVFEAPAVFEVPERAEAPEVPEMFEPPASPAAPEEQPADEAAQESSQKEPVFTLPPGAPPAPTGPRIQPPAPTTRTDVPPPERMHRDPHAVSTRDPRSQEPTVTDYRSEVATESPVPVEPEAGARPRGPVFTAPPVQATSPSRPDGLGPNLAPDPEVLMTAQDPRFTPTPTADTRPAGPGLADVLVIFAGKGGVGKTTTASSLAQRAGLAGRRVILIDANSGQGDLRTVLRIGHAGLPSIYQSAIAGGDITKSLIDPDTLARNRSPKQERLEFALVTAPPDHLTDPEVVTPNLYLSVIEQARDMCDLVIIDTQIIDKASMSGMAERLIIPLLRAGGWGIGISDLSTMGITNLLTRLKRFAGAGVARSQMVSVLNRIPTEMSFNLDGLASAMNEHSSFIGLVYEDSTIIEAMNQGQPVAQLETTASVLDAVLHRITGDDAFSVSGSHSRPSSRSASQPASRGFFGKLRKAK